MIKPLIVIALLAIPGTALAAQTSAPPLDPTEDPLVITAGFLSWHPDLRFRLHGMEAMEQQD